VALAGQADVIDVASSARAESADLPRAVLLPNPNLAMPPPPDSAFVNAANC